MVVRGFLLMCDISEGCVVSRAPLTPNPEPQGSSRYRCIPCFYMNILKDRPRLLRPLLKRTSYYSCLYLELSNVYGDVRSCSSQPCGTRPTSSSVMQDRRHLMFHFASFNSTFDLTCFPMRLHASALLHPGTHVASMAKLRYKAVRSPNAS
jgi:hypothetical protein